MNVSFPIKIYKLREVKLIFEMLISPRTCLKTLVLSFYITMLLEELEPFLEDL